MCYIALSGVIYYVIPQIAPFKYCILTFKYKVAETSNKATEFQLQLTLQNPTYVQSRKLHPTCDKHGNVQIAKRTATKGRSETYEVVKKIHGCTKESNLPTLSGLVDTLSVKFKKTDLVSELSKQDKLCNKVFPLIYNEKVA